ncbi:UDP-N-acetylmuramate--L-alanine ligase [Psychrilyobacter sp.]|uniref:UDP-N-acetylmuramate--L-alanine ligase n=1 Tax=Psychrilyobacter sp. TaxID=2586924 RepID=UPI0030173A4C
MKKIFFIGINGIGMSGLAKIMAKSGYCVSGSDQTKKDVSIELESLGVEIHYEHDAKNVEGIDLVVRSSAIKQTNPEYRYAIENGIEVIKRGEFLARLFNKKTGIAVAGTHGKTTTSSMLGAVMLPLDPSIVIGGILPEINSNAHCGTGEYLIAEADESDNSFLYLLPEYSIITNIEADHLENHGSFENIKKSFIQFYEQTKKLTLLNIDCLESENILGFKDKIVTYSIEKKAEIYADNIRIIDGKSVYDVILDGKLLGEFRLTVPGRHNVSNSLGVIYLAYTLGISLKEIKIRLENFKGAKRRYDILLDGDLRIIDDYAHHPTEIRATLEGAKKIETKKITAIFQPHRYSRVKFLYEEFKGCFDLADEVILLPVYSAGEEDIYGITLEELAADIYTSGNAKILTNVEEILEVVRAENRTYIFMGAGTISQMAHEVVEKLEVR